VILVRTFLDRCPPEACSKTLPFSGLAVYCCSPVIIGHPLLTLHFISHSAHPSIFLLHPFTVCWLSSFIPLTTLFSHSWSFLAHLWVLEISSWTLTSSPDLVLNFTLSLSCGWPQKRLILFSLTLSPDPAPSLFLCLKTPCWPWPSPPHSSTLVCQFLP
jgi:hypothetical protein